MTRSPDSAPRSIVRLTRLDGLRGLAACGVVFTYHGSLLFAGGQLTDPEQIAPLTWLRQWGWTFVDLFFVLSGYIFAHVYRGGAVLNGRRQIGEFAVARVARLYPLHLVMLLLVAVVAFGRAANTPGAFIANLLMLQAFIQPFGLSFNGPSWSISIECLCYLLFAVAASFGRRTSLGMTVLAVCWGAAMLVFHGQSEGPWVADLIPRGVLGFFIGQALWLARDPLSKVPAWLLAAGLIAGLTVPTWQFSPLLPMLLLAWPSALLLALRLPLMEAAPFRWIGDRSFGIYLIHGPLIDLIVNVRGEFIGSLAMRSAYYLCFVTLALTLSDMSLRWIEQPARRAIRRWWSGRAMRPAGEAMQIVED
ncbi:MAG: acyltransferase [Novosphingobium sp.]